MSRPGSVLFDERALSSMSVYRGPLSPTKGKRHLLQQQQFVMGEGDEVEQDKIRQGAGGAVLSGLSNVLIRLHLPS